MQTVPWTEFIGPNTDTLYLRLVVDLRRQAEGIYTAEQYWDEKMPETDKTMGDEAVTALLVAIGFRQVFRGRRTLPVVF